MKIRIVSLLESVVRQGSLVAWSVMSVMKVNEIMKVSVRERPDVVGAAGIPSVEQSIAQRGEVLPGERAAVATPFSCGGCGAQPQPARLHCSPAEGLCRFSGAVASASRGAGEHPQPIWFHLRIECVLVSRCVFVQQTGNEPLLVRGNRTNTAHRSSAMLPHLRGFQACHHRINAQGFRDRCGSNLTFLIRPMSIRVRLHWTAALHFPSAAKRLPRGNHPECTSTSSAHSRLVHRPLKNAAFGPTTQSPHQEPL